jgi:hypothetical protein
MRNEGGKSRIDFQAFFNDDNEKKNISGFDSVLLLTPCGFVAKFHEKQRINRRDSPKKTIYVCLFLKQLS